MGAQPAASATASSTAESAASTDAGVASATAATTANASSSSAVSRSPQGDGTNALALAPRCSTEYHIPLHQMQPAQEGHHHSHHHHHHHRHSHSAKALGPSDFLFGTLLGEGAYARVSRRFYVSVPRSHQPTIHLSAVLPCFLVFISCACVLFAQVLHARLKATGEDYAVKIMEKKFIKKEGKVALIMMERNILTKANHPNVIRLLFTFQVGSASP